MKTLTTLLSLLFLALPAHAQLFAEASRTLQEADHVKMVLGDLDRAAVLYQEVASSPSASRADVARALVSLAEVTEMSDPDKATDIYSRITTEFPDVSSSFQEAREALRRLGSVAPVASHDFTLVLEEMPPTNIDRIRPFAVSPDGERVAVVAPMTDSRDEAYPGVNREVYVMEVGNGLRRPLIKDPTGIAWMSDPRWSPDGRLIVFRTNTEDGGSIVVANVATGEADMFSGPEWNTNRPPVWMPDSRQFLLVRGNDLSIRSIDGTIVRDISGTRDIEGGMQPGAVSPDGQFLLYHSRSENSELNWELDIWMVDLETGEHRQLTDDLGAEGFPFWNGDGTAFFFTSGTEHVRNIVRQSLANPADREKVTSYGNAQATHPVYLPRSGKLAFVLATENSVIFQTDGITSNPLVRGHMGQLSPDGERLFYLDDEPGREGLWVASLDGSESTRLTDGSIAASYAQPEYVSPDGTTVAYTRHEGDETVIYTQPSTGGPATERFRTDDQFYTQPSWSPDGTQLAFSIDGDMYIMDAESGAQRMLSSLAYWEGWSLNWSPDGSQIAAFAYPQEGSEDMHVMLVDAESGETTQLTPDSHPHYKEGLDWHPDGTHLTYMYYGIGEQAWGGDGTEIIDVETREVETLVDLDGLWDYIGTWSPDGLYYFITTPPGIGNSWMLYYQRPGMGVTEATQLDGTPERSHSTPSFSRDGRTIIYGQRRYNNQLWIMDGIN